MREVCILNVIESILEEEFFDALRTKQQLGYFVSASSRNTRGLPGILFTIESSTHTPKDLQDRIETFIKDFYENTLTEEIYDKYLAGLIIKKSLPFKDIYQESSHLIAGLKDYYLEKGQNVLWHRRSREKQILQTEMSFSLIKETYLNLLIDKP